MPTRYEGTPQEVRALNAFIKLSRATETVMGWLGSKLSAAGLTMGQLAVLEALLHLGPMHQRALGRKLLRSDANITTVLDNLEGVGLVQRERSRTDRRFVVISLTPSGRARVEAIFPDHARRIAEALGALTGDEQEELGRLCRKLGTATAR